MGKRSSTKKPARCRGRSRNSPTPSLSPPVSDGSGAEDGRDPSPPPPSNASPAGSTASSATSISARQPLGMKKRAQKTHFCLNPEEEQIMCDFVRENNILWDVKKNDYRRVDKKTKLWEDQAKIIGKTVKTTILAHRSNLEAAENACANLAAENRPPTPVSSSSSQRNGSCDQEEDDILLSLYKRVKESGEVLKALANPREPITETAAIASYVRDSLMTMSKRKFKKAHKRINTILT
ncbi:hypothetical protein O3P69_007210 [Scylla paramamosain]|uniref:MADF domain-containing protein n=1 Tax=Scylla paramamosain TaxID=85552 RepID=A0AAW0V1Y2_SCYPA